MAKYVNVKKYKITVTGEIFGLILLKETGNTSFCYDCLFYSNDLKNALASAQKMKKNLVFHRASAVKALMEKM